MFKNIGELRDAIKDLPDDADIIVWVLDHDDTYGVNKIWKSGPYENSKMPDATPALHLDVRV